MIKRYFLNFSILLLSLILLGACTSSPRQKTWVETKKYVVIEAEDAQGGCENTLWKLSAEPEGWTGNGYLIWKGSSIWGHDKESVPYKDLEQNRILSYHIQINNPGTYFLKVRNYHVGKGTGDHAFDGDNDCFVSINKSEFGKQYDFNTSEFTWCETGNWRKAHLDKGIYQICIAGRSEDFGIDRLCLFHQDLAPNDHFGDSYHTWVYDYEWSTAPQSQIVMLNQK